MAGPSERDAVFDACYRQERDRIFRISLRFAGGRRALAEDITHDAFVKLYQSLPQLDDHQDLGGWLYRVAANVAISRLRREQSWLGRFRQLLATPAPAVSQPDEVVVTRGAAKRALETLDRLPPKERVVMCMKILDGMSQREIAEALSLSEGYVSKLVTRGWDRIRAAGWEDAP